MHLTPAVECWFFLCFPAPYKKAATKRSSCRQQRTQQTASTTKRTSLFMPSERWWCFLATCSHTRTLTNTQVMAVKWKTLRLTNRKFHLFLICAACFLFVLQKFRYFSLFLFLFLLPFVLYSLCNAFFVARLDFLPFREKSSQTERRPICLSAFSMLLLLLLQCAKMQRKHVFFTTQYIFIFVVKFMTFL